MKAAYRKGLTHEEFATWKYLEKHYRLAVSSSKTGRVNYLGQLNKRETHYLNAVCGEHLGCNMRYKGLHVTVNKENKTIQMFTVGGTIS